MSYIFAIHMQGSQVEGEMPWNCELDTMQKQLRKKWLDSLPKLMLVKNREWWCLLDEPENQTGEDFSVEQELGPGWSKLKPWERKP